MEYKEIYDISLDINGAMLSFPDDTTPQITKIKEMKREGYNLSKIKVSVHVGTHADAPSHFIEEGKNIDELLVQRFMGKAQVIEIKDPQAITLKELKSINIVADKVLFKTKNSNYLKEKSFKNDFVYLTYKAAKYLLDQKVKLIGIDYLTIESLDNKDFSVHKLLLENEIIIIEAVDLNNIEEGTYDLQALPLKIEGCEASPVRAILSR